MKRSKGAQRSIDAEVWVILVAAIVLFGPTIVAIIIWAVEK